MNETSTETISGFRSPQVCKVVGITYRQLDYWDRSGLLGPSLQVASGSGTRFGTRDPVRVVVLRTVDLPESSPQPVTVGSG